MHSPDVLFLCVCVRVCRRVGGWLLLWVLVVGPGRPTDGHRAGWVLGISHIQLYQCLYQSVCSQSLAFSIVLSPCLSLFPCSLEGRKIKVFCFLRKIFVSAFFEFIWRLNYFSSVVCLLLCVSKVMFGRHY